LPKCQKANVQDESVGQSSDTTKSSKVSKFGRFLLRSPTWKWFEEIYIDKIRHETPQNCTWILKNDHTT
ncbi:5079_t:CDS:2, partial [Gigaspora margarita]